MLTQIHDVMESDAYRMGQFNWIKGWKAVKSKIEKEGYADESLALTMALMGYKDGLFAFVKRRVAIAYGTSPNLVRINSKVDFGRVRYDCYVDALGPGCKNYQVFAMTPLSGIAEATKLNCEDYERSRAMTYHPEELLAF